MGPADTNPVRAHILTHAPKPVTATPALGPEGQFPATYESPAEARKSVAQPREGLTEAACLARNDVAYDAQAGGFLWFVSILGQSGRLGAGGAAQTAVTRQPGGCTTGNEGLGNGRRGYGHGGGGPHRVPAARTPLDATDGRPADMEMAETTEGPSGGGEGGGDHDSGSDSGGSFGTEHPSRPEPARWPHTTSSHQPP